MAISNPGAPPLAVAYGRRRILLFAVSLLALELLAIGTVFKHAVNFTCMDNWPQRACASASFAMVGLYCSIGAMVMLIALRPRPYKTLAAQMGTRYWPIALNLIGTAIAFLPVTFLVEGSEARGMLPALICWVIGLSGILSGFAFYIAPIRAWPRFIVSQWTVLLPVVSLSMFAPFLAQMLRPLWNVEAISNVTFKAVAAVISGLGYDVEIYPDQKIIGAGDFYIDVAPACSGIEGIALVTLFVTIYLSLFRRDLRFPRALLLYPLGIAASALFNVVRIAVLLIIGLEGRPELAVGGFHSHAGWLMFTVVALCIIGLAQSVPALQRRTVRSELTDLLPFWQDPTTAAILPFAVFMLSAVLAQTFSQTPSLIYPARAILMAGALGLFWSLYVRMPWRLDPVALGAGIIVGLVWVLMPVSDTGGPAPFGALTGFALAGWFLLRGIGTVLLVPIIEELFFRSYLEKRMRLGTGAMWPMVAAILTAGLFAALHDRWLEAFCAGLVFSWIARRHENITDAIVAHGAANMVVFGVAWVTGQMHII